MKKPDGGPAFPQQDISAAINPEGMTLRDYFAAKALETAYHFFADGYCGLADGQVEVDEHSSGTVARVAYEIADAMLTARGE